MCHGTGIFRVPQSSNLRWRTLSVKNAFTSARFNPPEGAAYGVELWAGTRVRGCAEGPRA
jgi:hypothetical protein